MTFYDEDLTSRILDLLSAPIVQRVHELPNLFQHCSLRELQDVFPALVQSIFGVGTGGFGWGLRGSTKENTSGCFDLIYTFFAPQGPMLRVCYRLLNDAIKFDFSINMLPPKLAQLMQSGHYSRFYADVLNVDPFRRQVASLSLNAFDYYMLHFVIHGTFPLHKWYPAALQVQNERVKTLYFFLTSDYLGTFLPSHPDGVVIPDIGNIIKAPQPIPVQPMQPVRKPRFLKIPQSSLFAGDDTNATGNSNQMARNEESMRACDWRTESVLHFFIDIWFNYEIGENADIPSSEFIRHVRVLIKHIHAFANSVHIDHSGLAPLRKIAQPMMKAHIYPFIKNIFSRWPLDSSLLVVLELWFSYIQPWRYTYETQISIPHRPEFGIHSRYDNFIQDNIVMYTQIFVNLLPRFKRLDFTIYRNCIMMQRLVKVFSQPMFMQKILHAEEVYLGNTLGYETVHRHNTSSVITDWDAFFHEEVYTPLFGQEVVAEIQEFIKTIYVSRVHLQHEINRTRHYMEEKQNSLGLFRKLFASCFEEVSPDVLKLQELTKIPDFLDSIINALSEMFKIELPNISVEELEPIINRSSQLNFSIFDDSNYFDLSKITPEMMRRNTANITSTIDPALENIHSYECPFIVRFLHTVSNEINNRYGDGIRRNYNRSDFYGKLLRQLVLPPMTAKWFDRPRGIQELIEKPLPARVCLRPMASYRFLFVVFLSFVLGYIIWHAPSLGILCLLLLYVVYFLVLAIFS
ncbi:sphingomyelin phosphodiesterase 4 isoform X2 [Teleopsis dalmanni]|uniref:sphingomyelin phosphodiesterase 4 isoform X2 n=1 Tax=Teleopsis dalmanni TaxID=139649 RepID=UPI0018CFCD45|nr:sphingomyelin phosphodiesterase 4 isoform X2 [Teleopsis dalmanni]